jgi:hypothetical protein
MYAVTADNKTGELLVDASATLASAKTIAQNVSACCRRRSAMRWRGLRS